MKKYLNFIIIIVFGFLLGFASLMLTRSFLKAPQPSKQVQELERGKLPSTQKPPAQPVETEKPLQTITPQPEIKEEAAEISRKINPVFDKETIGTVVDYPFVYAYFPSDQTLKKYNLKEKTFLEIFHDPNLNYVDFSPKKTKVILRFKDNPLYYLLDIENDRLQALPVFTQRYVFLDESSLILLRSNQSYLNELNLWKNFETKFLRTLGILEPALTAFTSPCHILLYEHPLSQAQTPLFCLNLNQPDNLKIISETKKSASVFSSPEKDYLVVSYKEGYDWQTKIFDKSFKEIFSFNLGLLKEKCNFQTNKKLVCAVPKNPFYSAEAWYQNELKTEDNIIVFDIENKDFYTILETERDIISPALTEEGLFFVDRLRSKLFFVKNEDLPLQKSQ